LDGVDERDMKEEAREMKGKVRGMEEEAQAIGERYKNGKGKHEV
jgi:hypothetical protein